MEKKQPAGAMPDHLRRQRITTKDGTTIIQGLFPEKAGLLAAAWEDRTGLAGALLDGIHGFRMAIPGLECPGAFFKGCGLESALLSGGNFAGARFQDCDLRWVRFHDADLEGAVFEGCNLRNASFLHANLRAAAFIGCDLGFASFMDADLCRPIGDDENCRAAVFADCDLRNADFRHADLRGASFTGNQMMIHGAFLAGAKLHGVDWGPANLEDAHLHEVMHAFTGILLLRGVEDAILLRTALEDGCYHETTLRIRLDSDMSEPAREWLDSIGPGATPGNCQVCRVTLGWIDQYAAIIRGWAAETAESRIYDL
jgi:uncharacterized protein YjbI with pentapeptide repeats